jgi:hypothetical protein
MIMSKVRIHPATYEDVRQAADRAFELSLGHYRLQRIHPVQREKSGGNESANGRRATFLTETASPAAVFRCLYPLTRKNSPYTYAQRKQSLI